MHYTVQLETMVSAKQKRPKEESNVPLHVCVGDHEQVLTITRAEQNFLGISCIQFVQRG